MMGHHLSVLFFSLFLCCLFYDAVGQSGDMKITCDKNSKIIRTIDGKCNNQLHPTWGSAESTYLRLIRPFYEDGKQSPREMAKDGSRLPDPRVVSTTIHIEKDAPLKTGSLLSMQWGQFVTHDMLKTKSQGGTCCKSTFKQDKPRFDSVTPNCIPLIFPENKKRDIEAGCRDFPRSHSVMDCKGRRQQIGSVTQYLDASTVYGSDPDRSKTLRTLSDGLLKITDDGQIDDNVGAGDTRFIVFPLLDLLHTTFLRYHNFVASKLKAKYTEDEDIYQAARRVVVAAIQHITFTEWMPLVLGQAFIDEFKLNDEWVYDEDVNPSAWNAFATAAMRFGHSMVMPGLTVNGVTQADQELFFVRDLVKNNMTDLVRSSLTHHSQTPDRFFTEGMTDHLFEFEPHKGDDIVTLNIQRGRDHGLPPFTKYKEFCTGHLLDDFTQQMINDGFDKVYKNVHDVDLYSAGIAETKKSGYGVGPTFACILGRQFRKTRNGDRFWYENPRHFSGDQFKELKKIKLSHILCQVLRDPKIDSIHENAFEFNDNEADDKRCDSFDYANLDLF